MVALSWASIVLWTIAAQGEGDIGNGWVVYQFVWLTLYISLEVGLVLLYTSICDIIFGGDDVAGWRHCITITFWILAGASALLNVFVVGGSLTGADPSWTQAARLGAVSWRLSTFMFSTVFMVIAHRKMHVVSRGVRDRG